MARFKLNIEYEGTRYSGWQKQENSKTIQGVLLNSCQKVFKDSKADIQGAGRTDSGVHAICQTAHLEVKTMLAPEIIRMKLNDELPHDINILEAKKANPGFHARHDAVSRSYIYQISRRRTAFGKNFVWWIKDKLDFEKMSSASRHFTGLHDFRSFADKRDPEKSTKVLINSIRMREEGSLILTRINASHFLWKMVRRMIGVLVEIGRGNLTEADLKIFLITNSAEPARYTAPPSGLFLEKILYKGEKAEEDILPVLKII